MSHLVWYTYSMKIKNDMNTYNNIHIGQTFIPKHEKAREKGYYMVVVDYHPNAAVGIGVIHMEDEPSSISYHNVISRDHYDIYDPAFDASPRLEKEKVLF